jgi:hypothetical protein
MMNIAPEPGLLPRPIGYWPPDRVTWPVDQSWDSSERDVVVAHLLKQFPSIAYRGCSRCRVCGCPNGNLDITDGFFRWPSGLAHYLIEHRLRPPIVFVTHVLAWGK